MPKLKKRRKRAKLTNPQNRKGRQKENSDNEMCLTASKAKKVQVNGTAKKQDEHFYQKVNNTID